MKWTHSIIAFYFYTQIEDPQREVQKHFLFLKGLDARARIYIASNGINGQMSLSIEDAPLYMDWLKRNPQFQEVEFKIDPYHEHVFPRLAVKARKQLVALDRMPDLSLGGKKISPEHWEKMLDNRDQDTILIDVRNHYESAIGYFEGALLPHLETFRQFPEYGEKLTEMYDPKETKVMMYCTGGIRCEVYSAFLKEKGFDQVYQLEGGVIHYGHRRGNKHWKGKLFVFDDRLSVPLSEDEHQVISRCTFCEAKSDCYYNCANMECNALFIACLHCGTKFQGCCGKRCQEAPRVRPYEERDRPKPFRRWSPSLGKTGG